MRIALLLCCWVSFTSPMLGLAESAGDVREQWPDFEVNWTRGLLTAKAIIPVAPADQADGAQALAEAQRQAARAIVRAIGRLRLDTQHHVVDIIAADESILAKIEQIVSTAPVRQQTALANGNIEATMQMQLCGGFYQLVLPGYIKPLEPLQAVSGALNGAAADAQTTAAEGAANFQAVFSGLVVDARGLAAAPAMVPLLVDEYGHEVYSPAFISREFAVQHGVCGYVRSMNDPVLIKRVAPKPMVVRGLRTLTKGGCDIVISNADASRLRSVSTHLSFLKQCRVVIVMD